MILCVFIFTGCFFFLYLKARLGPGPFIVATVFGAICVDIPMLTAALYPFPNYNTGKAIVVPLSLHAALSIVCSALVFPTTMTAQYTAAFNGVLGSLAQVLTLWRTALKMDPSSAEFAATAATIHGLVDKAEGGLAGTGATSRLLKRDIVWGRFSPSDVGALQDLLRPLVIRTNGMGVYFALIDTTREKFPMTPAPSAPATPTMSRTPSRPSTPLNDVDSEGEALKRRRRPVDHAPSPLRNSLKMTSPVNTRDSRDSNEKKRRSDHDHEWFHVLSRRLQHHHKGPNIAAHHNNHLHFSLLSFAHSLSGPQGHSSIHLPTNTAVGVFESQRYMTLEATRLGSGASREASALFVSLLQESCDDLMQDTLTALKAVQEWISNVRRGAFSFDRKAKIATDRRKRREALEKADAALKAAIETFRTDKRYVISFQFYSASNILPIDFVCWIHTARHLILSINQSMMTRLHTSSCSTATCISTTSCVSPCF